MSQVYFIYVQFKQTNIINTELINTNTKLIQIENLKLELLQSVYVRVCICNGVFINTNAYVYINTYG